MAAAVLINMFIVYTCNDNMQVSQHFSSDKWALIESDQEKLLSWFKFPEEEDKLSQSRAEHSKHLETEQGCQVSEEDNVRHPRTRTHTRCSTHLTFSYPVDSNLGHMFGTEPELFELSKVDTP